MRELDTSIRELPYGVGTLFLIKGIVYELKVRHEVWNETRGKEDYHYEMVEHSKKDAKPFIVDHFYLYDTPKQMSNVDVKPSRRWTK